MESSRPNGEKDKTKEYITPGNGDRHEKNEQELDETRNEGPGTTTTNTDRSCYLDAVVGLAYRDDPTELYWLEHMFL
ncbi:unnamed protein product [Schistosoma margrebowiei]|uniref:Uncharacterized protein n=1 Tax=Schistosoma margrebowiei TaxID=48269 RepID=A0A183N7T9_9TREM|nr:unnamed protein product [Schistosoma margrebowiei]